MLGLDLESFLISLVSIIVSLSVHEFSHGWVAYMLGDNTAKDGGRLSFNPLRHIDFYGIFFLVVIGFGWAKPVRVNTFNLQKPKRDIALISLAGPISNFILSFFMILLIKISVMFFDTSAYSLIFAIILDISFVSISLGVFNLIPLPPLDGYKVLSFFIPDRIAYKIECNQPTIQRVLIILLVFGVLNKPLYMIQIWIHRMFVAAIPF